MPAEVGRAAPEFTLLDQTRTPVSLSEFKGKKSLVVFIPFAFSPTCGSELCTIRDNLAALSSVDAHVVAISTDSHHANRVWSAQEGFEFKILSDFWPHGGVAQAYGCFNEQVGCAMRATYVLDEEGIVRAIVSTESLGQARQFGSYQEALAAI